MGQTRELELQDIRNDAASAYRALRNHFENDTPNYWQLGCCFDTMTDCLRILGPATDTGLAQLALKQYNVSAGQWYDDFAWWAIASFKAYDPAFAPIFGSYANSFKGIAHGCWNVVDQGLNDGVHNGAPQVYDNRDNESFFTDPPPVPGYWAKPRFDNGRGSGLHGVWQKDMFANYRGGTNWTGPNEFEPNPCQPSEATPLGPYQNTVVNALYFLATVRIEQMRRANPGLPAATTPMLDEWGFLRAWLGYDPNNPVEPIYRLRSGHFSDGTTMILERVGSYAFNDGGFPKVEGFDNFTSWAGDTGLMINAMSGYLQLRPGDRDIPALIHDLMYGYARHEVNANGVPQPYFPLTGNKLPGFDGGSNDYESGVGVFMRGILQAALIPNGPVAVVSREPEFQAFLRKVVNWAQNADLSGLDMFGVLNVLATLLAGIELLRP